MTRVLVGSWIKHLFVNVGVLFTGTLNSQLDIKVVRNGQIKFSCRGCCAFLIHPEISSENSKFPTFYE